MSPQQGLRHRMKEEQHSQRSQAQRPVQQVRRLSAVRGKQ
jgi:hypothetical protein